MSQAVTPVTGSRDTRLKYNPPNGPAAHREEMTPEASLPADPHIALTHALQQLADVLGVTTDEQYVQNPVGVMACSLGGHVRHCLDHFESLANAVGRDAIDYDQRERGTAIETNRSTALESIKRLTTAFDRLKCAELRQSIRVRSILAADGAAIETESSIGRELVFVLSHTIHHSALIAAMCKTLGIALPAWFGYAPATIAHLDGAPCVQSPSSR